MEKKKKATILTWAQWISLVDTKGYLITLIHSAMTEVYEGFILVCGTGRHVCVCVRPDETTKKATKCGDPMDYHCSSLIHVHVWSLTAPIGGAPPPKSSVELFKRDSICLLETCHHALWPVCIAEMILLTPNERHSDAVAFFPFECTQKMLLKKNNWSSLKMNSFFKTCFFFVCLFVCFRVGPV